MATRTYNAIDKTIDGLRLEEFDGAVEQLAQPFSNKNVYDIGRYVIYEGSIYQKITEPNIKNLLSRPYPLQLTTGNVLEENGITWSINTNGSITANGTATDDTSFLVDTNIITGEDYYTISGCPEGGSNSSYYCVVRFASHDPIYDTGTGTVFYIQDTITRVSCEIKSGTVVDNINFYPQLEIGMERTTYQQPGKLNEEFISSHWRLIKEL